ncbi:MAG TPA: hypothetical protein VIJ79_09345 [Acidobacteriaceae bacterium]
MFEHIAALEVSITFFDSGGEFGESQFIFRIAFFHRALSVGLPWRSVKRDVANRARTTSGYTFPSP